MKNLFFIFSILTFAKSTKMYEFFEYTLDPGSLLEINDLQNHFILVSFFQANPFALDVKYYDADDKKESLKFKTKETYLFKCSRITFFTNEINQKITMWKILDSFCNSSAVLMRTENLIEAVTENNIQQFPLCIFTQLEGDHFYVSTSTKPESHSFISYHPNEQEKYDCPSNTNCEFHSLRPFFLKVDGERPEVDFKLEMTYRINLKSGLKDLSCSLNPLPKVTQGIVQFVPEDFIGDTYYVCTNLAQETMNRVVSLIVTILVTVVVLFMIHCIGAINLFKPCQMEDQMAVDQGYQQTESQIETGSLLE